MSVGTVSLFTDRKEKPNGFHEGNHHRRCSGHGRHEPGRIAWLDGRIHGRKEIKTFFRKHGVSA